MWNEGRKGQTRGKVRNQNYIQDGEASRTKGIGKPLLSFSRRIESCSFQRFSFADMQARLRPDLMEDRRRMERNNCKFRSITRDPSKVDPKDVPSLGVWWHLTSSSQYEA
jgi:hypothetical protein